MKEFLFWGGVRVSLLKNDLRMWLLHINLYEVYKNVQILEISNTLKTIL